MRCLAPRMGTSTSPSTTWSSPRIRNGTYGRYARMASKPLGTGEGRSASRHRGVRVASDGGSMLLHPAATRRALLHQLVRGLQRVLAIAAGTALLAVGAALLVLPGPGTPVLLAGLALLATELAWADRLLLRAKARVGQAARWRPSRDGMKQVFQGLAACGAIVISIAAADEVGGMIGT
jgi:Putative transmembrane protein (PGPGW)